MRPACLLLLTVLALSCLLSEPGAARPVGETTPPRVISLDAAAAETAQLTWERVSGTRYRLCVATDFERRDLVACFAHGQVASAAIGVPPADGQVYYLTLQSCLEDFCSELVPAGMVARRRQGNADFYATALLLTDGRVRVSAFNLIDAGSLFYHTGAVGAVDLRHSGCDRLGVAPCGAETLPLPGALIGVSQHRGRGELADALTLQLRERPRAALIFDDGTGLFTGGRLTAQTILDEYGVKASFYIIGRIMRDYPGAVRALVQAGHRVGNHTYTHPFLTRLTDAQIAAEIDQTEAQFRAAVPGGTTKPCFRAPNGAIDRRVETAVNGRGYRQVNWTVTSNDWTGIPAARVTRNVLDHLDDGAIIAFHTQEIATITALRTIIPTMQQWGYTFFLPC